MTSGVHKYDISVKKTHKKCPLNKLVKRKNNLTSNLVKVGRQGLNENAALPL